MSDARLSTGLPQHPKTKRLVRRLGPGAAWSLVCLILWARDNRPDGDLSGMTDEDIELAVDWTGEPDALVATLAAVGFLDGAQGGYRLHDWAEHQPWSSGSSMRSAKARWNAVKRHHGEAEADRQVPEWAKSRHADSNAASTKNDATSTGVAMLETESSNAPSPSPSPSLRSRASSLRSDSSSGDADDSPPGLALDGLPADRSSSPGRGDVREHPTVEKVVEVVLEAYHRILPKCQTIHVLTPERRKRVLAADKLARQLCCRQGWKYSPGVFWAAYFETCAKDDWLRGERANPNNPRWKQNLGVLLEQERFATVMDTAIEAMRADTDDSEGEAA
jgi:hypothetical protein